MTAIINTYNRMKPHIIVYKQNIWDPSVKKTTNLFVRNEDNLLTSDETLAFHFRKLDKAMDCILKIIKSFGGFKNKLPFQDYAELIKNNRIITLDISANREIKVFLKEVRKETKNI